MTNYPMTPEELQQVEIDLREGYLSSFDLLEEIIDPESDFGRRLYKWLEDNDVSCDIEFIWNFESLLEKAKNDWQQKSN